MSGEAPSIKITGERVAIAVLAGAVGVMAIRGSGDEDAPTDEAIAEVAHQAIVEFAQESAAQSRAMASALRSGRIATDQEYLDWFSEHKMEPLEIAFQKFREVENAAIKRDEGEPFDVEAAAKFNESVADGFERVE